MNLLKLFAILTSLCLLSGISLTSNASEMYHLVLIPQPNTEIIETMARLGLPLDDAREVPGGLEIPLEVGEITLLESRGIGYRVIQEDLESYYGKICEESLKMLPSQTDEDPVHMKYGSMGGFYNFEEIVADLDSMHMLYPDICAEKVILGYGWENNPIYMVKISDNVGINEDEPEGHFDALHHAREPGSYTCMIYAMWNLLENYGTDPEMTYLVDNRELYFVPVVNVDGFLYNILTNPGGGGMWRKNRRDNGGGIYGVDLNRNYSYQWGYDNIGSSPEPSSSTYRGPDPASEPETQAMMTHLGEHSVTTAMTIHTAAGNGYDIGTCYQIMYASNGRTQDWQLHTHDIINVEPEVGGYGFWPPVSEIFPEAREIQDCFMNQFWCAGGQVLYSSVRVVDGYLTPGETDEIVVTVFNRGWGTSEAVEFELATSDPYITLSTATATTLPIPRRETADNASNPIIADIDPACPIGHQADFTLIINQGGYIRTEEFTMTVGTPTVFFEDDMESGIGGWIHEEVTPGWIDQWHQSTMNSHSPTHAWKFGDVGGGNYANLADGGLISPVIAIGSGLELKFWSWIDAEASGAYPDSAYDGGTVEISAAGGPWTTLPMDGYTHHIRAEAGGGNPYTGPFDPGTPVFSGNSGGWVEQIADLSAYSGDIQLRFRFGSDGGGSEIGWYVDDVQVTGFPSGATPAVAVTLIPYGTPIQIPATGGSFDFNIMVTNNEVTPVTFSIWTDVTLPNSSIYGPVIGPIELTPPGGASIERDRTQAVPAGAPTGMYTYNAYVGDNLGNVWDEDHFDFEKLATGDGEVIGDWASYGEEFDLTAAETNTAIPEEFVFSGVYPNPFNPSTTISFALPEAAKVNLSIYDVSGRLVAELVDGMRQASTHEVTFDGSSLASGIYIYNLTAGNYTASGKMVLMK
jgi:hypothetical protein